MKRIASLVASSLVALGALTAAALPTAAADPVKLTWFMWTGSDAEVDAWKKVADLVTKKYPDITIEFQTASFPNYWTKLPALAASNQLPDIISLQSMRAPAFSQLMEPLDGYIKKDTFDIDSFDKSIIGGLSKGGSVYALPYDFGPWVMFYNKDAFEKAGVPMPKAGWTEEDFMKAAKALTKDGKYGFAATVPDAFFSYARSMGASYLDKDGKLDLTNPGMKAAFQSYADLVAKDKVAPLFAATGTTSGSMAQARFTAGEVAMNVGGPWSLINLKSKVNFTIGVAPLPVRKGGSISLSAGSGFGIATTSKNKEAAWKAIQVLTGPDAEKFLASEGRAFAARTAFQKDWYGVAAKGVADAESAIPAALQKAEPYKTTPEWNTVSSLFEQYAPLAFSGSQTASEVLDTIQKLSTQ